MPKVYCSLNRGDYTSDSRVGCKSCRDHVSVRVKVPCYDKDGVKRVCENEIYCIAELAEFAMKNHPYFKQTNLSISFTNQAPVGAEEGKDE